MVFAEVLRLSRLLIKGLQMELRVETSGRFELPGAPPFVSVIIPAKDEEQNIEQTVRSILDSDYHNFEIVLTDDRSRDNTLDIMEALAREDTRIHVLVLETYRTIGLGKLMRFSRGRNRFPAIFLSLVMQTRLGVGALIPITRNIYV